MNPFMKADFKAFLCLSFYSGPSFFILKFICNWTIKSPANATFCAKFYISKEHKWFRLEAIL